MTLSFDRPRCGRRLPQLAAMILALLALAAVPGVIRADEPPREAMEHATALSRAFRYAAEKAMPSVVVVRAESKPRDVAGGPRRRGGGDSPFRGTPFEDMFPEGFEFNGPDGGEGGEGRRIPGRSGVGSGVIIDASGIVLTNNHVVEGADSVTVELGDGREFKAGDIKTDPKSDLAVLRLLDADGLPVAKLGDSDKLEIGDWVIAIGNPFELETTVSAGIISGKGRELGSVERAKFLQTDAAINPGNSGGPLVNLAGEVIGINTAIASNNGSYQGVGFAIPVNLAKWVGGQLVANGRVQRGYLGVQIGALSREMASKLGVKDRKGVLVNDVVAGTPAAEAGVEELDVITAFDGQLVDGPRTLQEVVERSDFDKPHRITVLRDGRKEELDIAVRPLPDRVADAGPPRRPAGELNAETYYSQALGLEVRAKEAGAFEGFEGVVVDRVDEGGLADQAGLGPAMLIRKVGREAVTTIGEFAAAVEKESLDDGITISVRTARGNSVILLKKRD
ncbi:MAG: trypsin-like peptidase domain-containing protein [Planctomycetaceae bacterium]